MGIENRNESQERPEQVEQFREQESRKGEDLKKKFDSFSGFEDDNAKANDAEYLSISEKKEKEGEAEEIEDKSDANDMACKRDYPETYQEWYDSLTQDQRDTHDGLKSNVQSFIKTILSDIDKVELYDGKDKLSDNGKKEWINKIDKYLSDDRRNELTDEEKGKVESLKISLTNVDDRKELSRNLIDYLEKRESEKQDSCRVEASNAIGLIDVDGTIEKPWTEQTDGAVFGSREMETVKKGTIIDRIGDPFGKCCCPLDDNGRPYSALKRATGDVMVKEPIEQNPSYHRYEILVDLTRENIEAAIHKTYPDISDRFSLNWDTDCECIFEEDTSIFYKGYSEFLLNDLDFYYKDCQDISSENHKGDIYQKESGAEEIDGIKKGIIDKMFSKENEEKDGGGIQYIMPFDISIMCELGLIKELE